MKRLFTGCVLLLAFATCVAAQPTAFNYQGSLNTGGSPANGNHDFEFALFDAVAAGSQLGTTLTRTNVSVANAVFAVSLDFGNVFTGPNRFLEIRVRPSGNGSFTTLTPRQQINSAPYSVRSLNADTATNSTQLGGVNANQYVLTTDSRMTDARNPLPNSGSYIQNQNSGPQASSNFNISGNGTAGGTFSGSIVNAATQYNLGGARILSQNGNNLYLGLGSGGTGDPNAFNNSFFGTNTGPVNTGFGNSFFGASAGQSNSSGTNNTFLGSGAGISSSSGSGNTFVGLGSGTFSTAGFSNSFFGEGTGFLSTAGVGTTLLGANANVVSGNLTNATAIGYQATVGQSNSLVLGSISGLNGSVADTNVGIGTAGPTEKLHIAANSGHIVFGNTGCSSGFAGLGFASSLDACNNYGVMGNVTDTMINRAGGGRIFFRESNTNQMTIAAGGNVGVGTITPENKLHVAGAIESTGPRTGPAGQAVTLSSESTFDSLQSWSNRPLSINGAGNNVGIGTTAPSAQLHVAANSGNVLIGNAGCPSGQTAIGFVDPMAGCTNYALRGGGTDLFLNRPTGGLISFRENNSATSQLHIAAGGNVGIGTSSPADKLDVIGSIRVSVLGMAGPTPLCRNASNQISLCSSSGRYKSNINPFNSGMSLISRLRPVSFNWREGGLLDLGLVAEEVAKTEPLLTTTNASGQVEGVKYDRIAVVLINAMKEQQAEVETLRMMNTALDERLKKQQDEIEKQRKELEQLKRILCGRANLADLCGANE